MLYHFLALCLALSLGLNLLALRWTPRDLQPFLVAAWFVSSIFWKSGMVEHELGSKLHLTPGDWGWVHFDLWMLAIVTIWVSRGLWWAALWLVNAFFSLLFWIDLLYYRYFDSLPALYILSSAKQGAAAWPSAWAERKPIDATLAYDLIVMVVALWLASPRRLWTCRLPRELGPLMLAVGATINYINIAHMDKERARLLRLRFHNMAMVDELGLFHYHFYDAIQLGMSRYSALLDPHFDETALRQTLDDTRASVAEKTPYLGVARGKNLLMVQLESFESFLLDLKVDSQNGPEEVTPFVNQLQKECLVAALQDQSGEGRSSDGEFIYLNSLLPPGERPLVYAYPSNEFHGMPAVLNAAGYDTTYAVPYFGSFWNCGYMSERYGFKHRMLKDDFTEPEEEGDNIGWGLSDQAIFKNVIPKMVSAPKPFFFYVVTMMGHHPYTEIDDLPHKLHLTGPVAGTAYLSRYLECARMRDDQLRQIVTRLKETGLWDNTVVVMFGDHDARIPDDEMALLLKGRTASPEGGVSGAPGVSVPAGALAKAVPPYGKCDKIVNDRVMVLMHSPGDAAHGRISGLVGQVDVDPTILHLLGVTDLPESFTGLNLLGTHHRSFIVSKGEGGYALDSTNGIRGEGGEWTQYSLADRKPLPDSPKLPLLDAAEARVKLYMDVLRLNLVPWMLKQH